MQIHQCDTTSAKPSTSEIATYVAGGMFALLVVEAIAFVIYKAVKKKKVSTDNQIEPDSTPEETLEVEEVNNDKE